MTKLQSYEVNEKNHVDARSLKNTDDMINPKMEKAMYKVCKEVVPENKGAFFANISRIGKHRSGGLLSEICSNSEKIFKVFHYYFIDHVNQTAGYTFRLIEEMLPTTTFEQYGQLTFVSKSSTLEKEVNELVDSGHYEEAVERMNAFLIKDPDDIHANYQKGHALEFLQRYDDAIACYDKALQFEPKDIICLIKKGVALRNLQKYDEAIACYDKALDIDPNTASALSSKGVALRNLQRYDEAIACYDKALDIDSGDFKIWMNKGNVLRTLQKYDEAIACYDKALILKPHDELIIQIKNELVEESKR